MRAASPSLSLSIVIPTKNRPAFLQQAVQSALEGLPGDAEILVIDDRSAPPVLAFTDPRVRVIQSGSRPGASGARNWGVAQARGRRILFLDDDDLLLSGYAAWVSGLGAEYGFSEVIRFSTEDLPPLPMFMAGGIVTLDGEQRFRRKLSGLGCGFWIDRSLFEAVGGIDEALRVNEDTDFSIKLLRTGAPGLRSMAPGVAIRTHTAIEGRQGHLTAALSAEARAACFDRIIQRNQDWLVREKEARTFLLARQIKYLVRAGDRVGLAKAVANGQGLVEKSRLRAYAGVCRLFDRWRGL